jgi:hypothetical protein
MSIMACLLSIDLHYYPGGRHLLAPLRAFVDFASSLRQRPAARPSEPMRAEPTRAEPKRAATNALDTPGRGAVRGLRKDAST